MTPILATPGTNNVGLFDMLMSRGCNVKAKEEVIFQNYEKLLDNLIIICSVVTER